MILVDTDIFIIDIAFQDDKRFEVNKRFLDEAQDMTTSIFNLLEICGLASFQLSPDHLVSLFGDFHSRYDLTIVYPTTDKITDLVKECFERIQKKMNFPDALIAWVAEENHVDLLVTWNKKHFDGRTTIDVMTPEEFLKSR